MSVKAPRRLVPSDVGCEIAALLEVRLRTETAAGLTDEFFASAHDGLWADLVSSGWLLLGAPDESGGGGGDLVDLLPLGEVVGRTLVPLPIVPALVASRWKATTPVEVKPTYGLPALPRPGGIVPFASLAGATCIDFGSGAWTSMAGGGRNLDDWAPSLPFARVRNVAPMPVAVRREIAVLNAAEAVGAASEVLDLTVAYANTRVQFGEPIGSFQAVKHHAADMLRDLELARTAVAWAARAPRDARRAVGAALQLSRAVIERGIQIHGGIGYTWDVPLHRYLRHVVAAAYVSRDFANREV